MPLNIISKSRPCLGRSHLLQRSRSAALRIRVSPSILAANLDRAARLSASSISFLLKYSISRGVWGPHPYNSSLLKRRFIPRLTARLKKVRWSAGVTSGQLNCQTTYLTAQAILNAFWGWNGAHYKCGNACNFKTTLPDQSGALPALEGRLPSSPAVTGNPDLELWLMCHSTRPGRINTLA